MNAVDELADCDGRIRVPIRDRRLLWVRAAGLESACESSGVLYARPCLVWDPRGRCEKRVKDGVVVARGDAPALAAACRAWRKDRDADGVMFTLALAVNRTVDWATRSSVTAGRPRPARVAAWADRLSARRRREAAPAREWFAPGFPPTAGGEFGRLVDAVVAAGWPGLSERLVDMVAAGFSPEWGVAVFAARAREGDLTHEDLDRMEFMYRSADDP